MLLTQLSPVAAAVFDTSAPTILITGSNRGLGLEFTRQYAAAGWNIIASCRDPATCAGLTALLSACESDADCDGGGCGGRIADAAVDAPIDWNQDENFETGVIQSIDSSYDASSSCGNGRFAAELTSLTGYDDWANMRFRFGGFGRTASAHDDDALIGQPEVQRPDPTRLFLAVHRDELVVIEKPEARAQ